MVLKRPFSIRKFWETLYYKISGFYLCENMWGGVGRSTFPGEAFKYLGAFQCKFDEQFELFERHDAYAETSESISASFQGLWHSP